MYVSYSLDKVKSSKSDKPFRKKCKISNNQHTKKEINKNKFIK